MPTVTKPWFTIRLDGRSFSKLTKGLHKESAYSTEFGLLMIKATKYIQEEFNADCAYVGSDEITLGWFPPKTSESQRIFTGQKTKLLSVSAGALSSYFAVELAKSSISIPKDCYPHFDSRISIECDTEEEFQTAMKERVISVTRNSISMLAQFHFSARELKGKKSAEMREMLIQKDDPWGGHPFWFKFGMYLNSAGTPVVCKDNFPPSPSTEIIEQLDMDTCMTYGSNHVPEGLITTRHREKSIVELTQTASLALTENPDSTSVTINSLSGEVLHLHTAHAPCHVSSASDLSFYRTEPSIVAELSFYDKELRGLNKTGLQS